MLEIHEVRALVIKHLTDEVSEAEMRQLEEWASLSTENRIWLQRFFDLNVFLSMTNIMLVVYVFVMLMYAFIL